MRGIPQGLTCPGCESVALIALGAGDQAFCPNLGCAIFTWNPLRTLEENARDMKVISPRFLAGE